MNIRDFADQHGVRTIVRRHFQYNKPAVPGDSNLFGSLVYTRQFDFAKLGLSMQGVQNAIAQGHKLAELGVIPDRIVCGIDQRNYDGARFTAEAIKEKTGKTVPFHTCPGVTYPHYSDSAQTQKALQEYGDMAVHAYLSERQGELCDLWTESPVAFESRILAGIRPYHLLTPRIELFDLNFEQMVLLHYLHVEKIDRVDIPCGKGAWMPTMGGGIVYGADGQVAEFDPNLNLLIPIVE